MSARLLMLAACLATAACGERQADNPATPAERRAADRVWVLTAPTCAALRTVDTTGWHRATGRGLTSSVLLPPNAVADSALTGPEGGLGWRDGSRQISMSIGYWSPAMFRVHAFSAPEPTRCLLTTGRQTILVTSARSARALVLSAWPYDSSALEKVMSPGTVLSITSGPDDTAYAWTILGSVREHRATAEAP